MSSDPRWWRISFRITIILLSFVAAVFLWAAISPMSTEYDEWTKLSVAILSALTGFLLIAVLLGLLIFRWFKARAKRSSPTRES